MTKMVTGLLTILFGGLLLSSNYVESHALNVSVDNSSDVCGRYDETLFVNNNDDLELLTHCRVINTSIFITGGYQIYSLKLLSNLQYIMGYIVIIDSHEIGNLYGLHNLVAIKGNELYSNNYSVVIRHNIDHMNSPWGLCYMNTINWTMLTDFNPWINDNGPFCSDCDAACNGCWGPGPQLCQLCKNNLSGITCVEVCPVGADAGDQCIEKIPDPPILNFHVSNYYIHVHVNYNETTNGVLLGYELLKDNSTYVDYKSNRESWSFFDDLIINVTNLLAYTIYNFSMKVYNTIGYSNYSDVILARTDVGIPPQPLAPIASVVNNAFEVRINETADANVNGPIIKYVLENNFNEINYQGNYVNLIMVVAGGGGSALKTGVNYSFILKAYTNDFMMSASNLSNEVMIPNSVPTIDVEDDDISVVLLTFIIIGSFIGALFLAFVVLIIINKIRKKGRKRRQLDSGDGGGDGGADGGSRRAIGFSNPQYATNDLYSHLDRSINHGAMLNRYYSEIRDVDEGEDVDEGGGHKRSDVFEPYAESKIKSESESEFGFGSESEPVVDNVFEPYSEPDIAAVPSDVNDTYMMVKT